MMTKNQRNNVQIVALFTQNGFVDSTKALAKDERVGVILDRSSFYAESGGQIYDTGVVASADGTLSIRVEAVQSYAGFVMHMGCIESGTASVGQDVTCMVDYERRKKIAPNHTMTHVLNFALRKVLGTVADQRGSLVDEARLRFDFTNNKPLKPDQIEQVEKLCQEIIQKELDVYTETAPQAQAKRIQGLRAVFGETYPDYVRVISVGQEISTMLEDPDNSDWSQYSVEFCGGTHLKNTKEAVDLALYEETAIAKGIRRVSACTGEAAMQARDRADQWQTRVNEVAQMEGEDLVKAVAEIKPAIDECMMSLSRKNQLRKQVSGLVDRVKKYNKEAAARRMASGVTDAAAAAKQALDNKEEFVVVSLRVGTDVKLGREMLEAMTKAHPTGSFLIVSIDEMKKKTACFCQVSESGAATVDAREWVNAAMRPMNGKGGGKSALSASGQSKSIEKVDDAVTAAQAFCRRT